MKLIFFVAFFLLFVSFANAELIINEIMYNPAGSDSYLEWIEIYNNGTSDIDLTVWTLCDDIFLGGYVSHSNGNIYLNTTMILKSTDYAIITDGDTGTDVYDNILINESAIALHINTSSMCSSQGLSNTNDSIILTNGTYFEIVNYSSSYGADGNNYTLERRSYNWVSNSSNWVESLIANGTPGRINNRYSNSSVDYFGLIINEFLPNPEGTDNADMPGGEWVEIYNSGNDYIDLEGLYLEDKAENKLIITRTNVYDSTIIKSKNYKTVYRNSAGGFSLNNDDYEEVKLYDSYGSLIDKVSYSFTSEGVSWMFIDNGWVKDVPNPGAQNYESKGYDKSVIKIDRIYDTGSDKKAKWGQTIRLGLEVYKGDTTKNYVKVWAGDSEEKISKVSSFNVYNKFSNDDLTIPLQLIPNCNKKYEDGEYPIYAEGLDVEVETDIIVEGITENLCEKVPKTASSNLNKVVLESVIPPSEINNEAVTNVVLFNGHNEPREIELWSYVYKGSNVISGDRISNIKKMKIAGGERMEVELKNEIEEVASGDYKIKIKLKQEGRVTEDEFTSDVKVNSLNINKEAVEVSNNIKEESLITSNVVYESSDVKARKYGLYFFNGTLVLLVFYLLFKKTL